MADQSFGVKQLNLLGSGVPTIESPSDLNLNANNVAISTNLTVGNKVSVLSTGIVTSVSGVVTYYGDGSNLTGISTGGAGWTPDSQENLYAGTSAGCCSNTHANFNVAIGYSAGSKLGKEGSGWGQENVYIGKDAGVCDGYGLCNTFIGARSGKSNNSGFYNTFLGWCAGASSSSSNGNVYIGFKAGSSANAYCNTFLGACSGKGATGACNVAIGQHVALANNSGTYQLAIGSGNNNWIDGDNNFNIGIGTNTTAAVGAGVTAKLSVGIVSAYQYYGGFFESLGVKGSTSERINIVANKVSAASNINIDDGMIHYFTTQETTTSTPNIKSTNGINSDLAVGDSITVVIINTAASAGYSAQMTIEGSAQTEKWLGASAPSTGSAQGHDVYTYNIIKTASNTYTVLANMTNFA
tara:strand:+ start:559 stop:1791 length:1233 start_codon:yes stop_codon:yes gene_type:complete